MANYELMGLNEAGPDLRAPTSSDTGAVAGAISAGTTITATTGMAVGGATAGAGGIAFPATATSIANANTLDDYEEGYATVALAAGTGTITIDPDFDQVSYTKIGRLVYIQGRLRVSAVSSPSGAFTITGMPFAADTLNDGASQHNIIIKIANLASVPDGGLFGEVSTASEISVRDNWNLTTGDTNDFADHIDAGTSAIIVSGWYVTAT